MLKNAPVFQWIECEPPELEMWVRFPPGVLIFNLHIFFKTLQEVLMRRKFFITAFLIISLSTISTAQFKFPFQNPNLNIEERVNDLISRMTLEEKVSQMIYNAAAIERLDIPE